MDIKKIAFKFQYKNEVMEFHTDSLFAITGITGLESSDFQVTVTQVSQFDGGSVSSKKVLPRSISFTATCLDTAQAELRRRELIQFFSPYRTGNLFVEYGGLNVFIPYEVISLKFSQENIYAPFDLLLELLCPNPFFRDVQEFSKNMAGKNNLIGAPLVLPPRGLVFSARTMSQEENVYNHGDKDTGLIVTFAARGPVINPSLQNLSTGEYIKINLSMQAGDRVVINTNHNEKTVQLNGENVSHKKDRLSNFFQMHVGDNLLKYNADDGITNLDVYPKWSAEFLGV